MQWDIYFTDSLENVTVVRGLVQHSLKRQGFVCRLWNATRSFRGRAVYRLHYNAQPFRNTKKSFPEKLEWFGWMPVCFIIMQMMITSGNSEPWRLKQLLLLWETAINEIGKPAALKRWQKRRLGKRQGKRRPKSNYLHQVKCLNSWQPDCKWGVWAPMSCGVTSCLSAD